MSRTTTLIVAAGLGLVALIHVCDVQLSAAPLPRDLKEEYYFPLKPGTRWVYETASGEDSHESIELKEVTKKDDQYLVERRGFDETRVVYNKMYVSRQGLAQPLERSNDELGFVLRSDIKLGDSWKLPDGSMRKLAGSDVIQVPAGRFKTLRVEWEQNTTKYTSWYALGVGEVQRSRTIGDNTIYTRRLKSFKLGD